MLDSLRRWASGWVASILIGLLVLSFAIWGIADVFTGYSQGWLATVGSKEIRPEDFQREFQEELARLSRQAGRRISSAQARAVGLDRQVLDRLIGMNAIEMDASNLGLKLSDATLADGLKRDPLFAGVDGEFSREMLDGLLRQNGMSEDQLLALRRRDKLRGAILKAIEGGTIVPAPLVDVIHSWRQETRIVEYATIDADKMIQITDPDDAALTKAYDDSKSRYMSDPMRALSVLLLSIDSLKKKAKVEDAHVKDSYESTKDSYDKPEQRRIQQISFPDAAAAKAAKAEIDKGLSFKDAAKKAGASETDIDLGVVAKSALFDPKIAEAAFSLKKDSVSDVIEGRFATVLLRVGDITPGKKSTFDEVKGEVRSKLAGEMALVEVQTVYTEIDDLRAAGKTLDEISKSLDLPAFEIGAVDRTNKTPEGGTGLAVKEAAKIIKAGFDGEIGVEQEAVQLKDGGFAWVEVISKTPAKQKPLEEVKDQVKTRWIEDTRRKALSELAAKLVERLNAGETFDKIAKEIAGKVEKTEAVTRAKIPDRLTEAAMSQVFVLAEGRSSSAETSDGKSRTLFRVVEENDAPKATEEDLKALHGELSGHLQIEETQQYVDGLKSLYGVVINEKEFVRIMGAETQ